MSERLIEKIRQGGKGEMIREIIREIIRGMIREMIKENIGLFGLRNVEMKLF